MTVKEIIERLSKFEPELEVNVVGKKDNPINDYWNMIDVYQITGSHSNEAINGYFIVYDN